jgi:hypothetical protein
LYEEFIKTAPKLPDGKEYIVTHGSEKSIEVMVKAIREQGPFDGVFSFSQGGWIFRVFNLYT